MHCCLQLLQLLCGKLRKQSISQGLTAEKSVLAGRRCNNKSDRGANRAESTLCSVASQALSSGAEVTAEHDLDLLSCSKSWTVLRFFLVNSLWRALLMLLAAT